MNLQTLMSDIKIKKVDKPFKCQFCNQGFTSEKTIISHLCEKKRRFNAKDDQHVRIGYNTYVRFFELIQKSKVTKTYQEFINSDLYSAFVKFGSFINNVSPLYPTQYIDWILKSGIKIDQWCTEEYYYQYVLDLIQRETSDTALKRTINTMFDWAEQNNKLWSDYFTTATTQRIVYDIRDGKISPWLILNCNSGISMMNRLNDEQLSLVYKIMDPSFWTRKFKTYSTDVTTIKHIVKENNL